MNTEELLDVLLAGRTPEQVLADAARVIAEYSEGKAPEPIESITDGGYSHGRMPSLTGT